MRNLDGEDVRKRLAIDYHGFTQLDITDNDRLSIKTTGSLGCQLRFAIEKMQIIQ